MGRRASFAIEASAARKRVGLDRIPSQGPNRVPVVSQPSGGYLIDSGVPSDQFLTGKRNTVTGSSAPVLARSGEPFEFAPQFEGLVRGRKNIRCGCQGPPASS